MQKRRLSRLVAIGILTLSLAAIAGAQVDEKKWTPRTRLSSSAGKYCDAESTIPCGASLNLNSYCRATHTPFAVAVPIRPDAYGWVCRIPGKPDRGLNMHAACRWSYGKQSIAALVGIRVYDWRCIRPSDVNGKVVPILLFPVEKMTVTAAPFVTASVRRLEALMGGIRRFYRVKSGKAVKGTTAFVLLTATNATDWQNLAIATDHESGGFPVDRFGFFNRVRKELTDQRWNVLLDNSSVRVGGFVSLGPSPVVTPTYLGAAAAGALFAQAPSVSYAACSSGAVNSAEYENAFYAAGHEFGHTMNLPHTDQYGSTLPSNWRDSIMYLGKGTDSEFFPFEVEKLLTFLNSW
jgi:hypothetical protein